MRKTHDIQAKTELSMAFDRINSVVGDDLDDVVRIIEKHGKKKKLKKATKPKHRLKRVLVEV